MNNKIFLCSAAAFVASSFQLKAKSIEPDRPNILWLTFEDTSWFEFGCYGNNQVSTPVIDGLAEHGVQFMNASSVAPQSSPARSSLITGSYATSYAMDLHPVPFDTPEGIFFPQYLRDAGYYCTNNSKTHYNTTVNHKGFWDESNKDASYNSKSRKDGQPFFAVFNTVTSHMGRIRTHHTDGRRDYTESGIYPEKLDLPPHLPDLHEIRIDYAAHLEAVQDVDEWVGFFIDDLKDKDLYDNTIIFVFSDHGGCLPRGKGYLFETGLRVPLIVHYPPKWEHLSPVGTSVKDERLVDFTDLGPTALSLAGIKPPAQMTGQPISGKYAVKEKSNVQFGFATNQLHHFMPNRSATDGRFKYIRSYIPYKQFALRNYYQWGMPSNKAWDSFVLNACNEDSHYGEPYQHHKAEMLFDLEADPFEINDLSNNMEYQEQLTFFRNQMSNHIRETKDLGFFLPTSRENVNLYNRVNKEGYPIDELHSLVELASIPELKDVDILEKALSSNLPDMRYWAAVGFAQLGVTGKLNGAPEGLIALLNDDNAYVTSEAAYALAYLGNEEEGIKRLVYPVNESDRKIGYSLLECISLDRNMKDLILPYVDELKEKSESLPHLQNEDAGLMARGILVNLGHLNIRDLHGKDAYDVGLKLNRGRRPMVPTPQ